MPAPAADPTGFRKKLEQALGSGFKLGETLGGGGMSTVYVADQLHPARRVVVKVLARELATADALERFQREIALIAELQHPQIVPVIAAGEADGLPWFVMPFVSGESLRQRLRRGPLPIQEVVAILNDVSRALVHAHSHGVVHRDIKPDNILMAKESAVVSDFGVARALSVARRQRDPLPERLDRLTSEGMSLGTPAYMAPEQLAGGADVDHRADLYALGVVGFEMLVGSPPFMEGTARQQLTARLTEPPPPISRRRADVPPRLADLVAWCLEKEPQRRPDASAVRYALQDAEFLAAGPRNARAPGRDAGRDEAQVKRAAGPGTAHRLLEALTHDGAYALRGLRRRPGFAAMVVLTLSLGIGANATMFGILDRLLFRAPAHIVDVDRIVQVHSRRLGSSGGQTSHPYVVYKDFQGIPEFESVAVTTQSVVTNREYYPLGRGTSASRVAGAQVSPSFFPLLGVRPHRGRFFHENEAGDNNPQKLAVLGYRFWQRHFGGLDAALGQSLELGTDRYVIVGVAPEGFTGIELSDIDVWIPIAAADGLRFAKGTDWNTTRNSQWLWVIARLKPGASLARAEARATAIFRAGERERVAASNGRIRQSPESLVVSLTSILPARSARSFGLGRASTELRVSRLLGAVSLMVLLMACVNVATLLLVRAMARRREIAVRLALGVTRLRLIGQLLTEGMILSFIGAVGALACAHFASGSIRAMLLADNAWTGSAVDGRMLAYTGLAALATGILTSLLPALHASREGVGAALKSGSREGTTQRSRVRAVLLVAQSALAVVLLAGAGLFVGSLRKVAKLPLGVDVDRVLAAEVQHASVGMSNADAYEMFRRFTEAAHAVPGITAAATTIGMSFGLGWGTTLSVPGKEPPRETNNPSQYAVTPEYFEVMGIRLVSGRTFTELDRAGTPLVAVINETTARTFWPGEDPVGQCVRIGADSMPCTTVVGIVANARRQQLVEDPVAQIYRPLDQVPASVTDRTVSFFGLTMVARTARNARSLAEPLRRALQQVEPRAPYVQVRPLTARVDRFTRSWRLGATMFSIFGSLALVLAAVGLYSVVAFTIAQRQHEFGVRVALGASGGSLVRLNVGRGVAPAMAGIAIGLGIVLLAGKFVRELLFELSPRDPMILGSVVVLLLVAATLASFIPARRAAKVDPAIVLRSD